MNFLERFSKYPQTFPDKFFIAERQPDRGMYMMNITVELRNYGSPPRMCLKCREVCEMPGFFKRRAADITLLYIRLKQLYTRSIGLFKGFEFGMSQFQLPSWRSVIQKFDNIHFCVFTTFFLTLPVYYKLQNAEWFDENIVHNIDPAIHFKRELRVTVKLYRAACRSSDPKFYSFPNQKNSCWCSLLNPFFSQNNHKVCKNSAKRNCQIWSPHTALWLSRLEGHD
jgi:hypothetical protein